MSYRSDYLNIHDMAYRRLRADGKSSWSEPEDISERLTFYFDVFSRNPLTNPKTLVLGCGDGEITLAIAKRGGQVTGVDVSPVAIEWAKEKASERKIEARFILQNLAENSSSLGLFDVVIDDHCLHCIVGGDRATVLDFVRKSLGSNGVFIVRTQCGDPPKNAPPEILKSWDPGTRCQVHSGVAGRYFGMPEVLLSEFRAARFDVKHSRVFEYASGWQMLEAVLTGD